MALQQINLRVEAELLERLKLLARERGLSLNLAAAMAFETWLGGQEQAAASGSKQSELEALALRVAAIERMLSQRRSAEAPAAKPASQPTPATAATEGAVCTAHLAEATGTNRAGWNNWASEGRIGQVRNHTTAGQWRLVGKAPAPGGGPDRWLWEEVQAG